MKYIFAFLLMSVYSITTFAQNEINGIIVDRISGYPISGAHITTVGLTAVSDAEGKFKIQNLKQGHAQLKVSHVSYDDKVVTVAVNDQVKIELSAKVIELEEVVVNSKPQTIKFGSLAKKPAIVYFGHVKGDIKVLKIKNENGAAGRYFKSLNYYFVQSKKTLGKGYNGASFLIKIYDIDNATGLPGTELTTNQIKVTSKGRNKWMSVDISELRLRVPTNAFFIGVEFTEDRGFETQFGGIQIEPCFGGTSEFGQEELCYSRQGKNWDKSAQNIMVSVDVGESDGQ